MINLGGYSFEGPFVNTQSLEDSENLPDPEILASDIAENLESALEQFRGIQEKLE